MWALAMKEESLWVRWISTIYLRRDDFVSVQAKTNDGWHWKQILKARDQLAPGFSDGKWTVIMDRRYSVASGYDWLLGVLTPCRFAPVVWNRCLQPKHAFVLWLVTKQHLLTKDRLASWSVGPLDCLCVLCGVEKESLHHLFFDCCFSQQCAGLVTQWLGMHEWPLNHKRWRVWLGHCGHGRSLRVRIWSTGMAALVYFHWQERNRRLYDAPSRSKVTLVQALKGEFKCRLPAFCSEKCSRMDRRYVEQLLSNLCIWVNVCLGGVCYQMFMYLMIFQ